MVASLPWSGNSSICASCRLRYISYFHQKLSASLRRAPFVVSSRNLSLSPTQAGKWPLVTPSPLYASGRLPRRTIVAKKRCNYLSKRTVSSSSIPPPGGLSGATSPNHEGTGTTGSPSSQAGQTFPRPAQETVRSKRPFSGSGWGKTSWDTSRSSPQLKSRSENDGLLPHERLARDLAISSSTPLKKPATKVQGDQEAAPPRRGDTYGRGQDRPRRQPLSGKAHDQNSPDISRHEGRHSLGLSKSATPSHRVPSLPNVFGLEPMRHRHNRIAEQGSARTSVAQPRHPLGRSQKLDGDDASGNSRPEWGQLVRKSTRSPSERSVPFTGHSGSAHHSANGMSRPLEEGRRTRSRKGDAFLSEFKSRMTGIHKQSTRQENADTDTDTAWDWADDIEKEQTKVKPQTSLDHEAATNVAQLSANRTDSHAVQQDNRRYRDHTERHRTSDRDKPSKRTPAKRVQRAADEDEFDDEAWERHEERRHRKLQRQSQKDRAAAAEEAGPTPILLPQFISVSNLAAALGVKSEVFVLQLEELGFENISHDSIMTGETAALVAAEYGFDPKVDEGESRDLKPRPPPADPSILPSRPPIVTIMGHVDHGKTTMLDWLRKSSIAAQEHGGITQHIGAFSVKLSTGKLITFLDTPGHAAFLTMRQRGANVTDIVVLVVAADDSVKPQTLEALKHGRGAKVPIIVAINKIDKDEARVDQVKSDLARQGVEIEDYGGDVQVVCVSGKTGQGMDDLEENILTLSEILDMRAETDGMAEGWILESSITPTGKLATVLVKRGTLRPGDYIVAGSTWAKIRSLRNEAGVDIEEAPPGTPVEILGWRDTPTAGDEVIQAPDESKAKTAAEYRQELKEREAAMTDNVLREQQEREKAEREASEQDTTSPSDSDPATKLVNFAVKGDVMGSVEAVCAAVMEIGNNEVRPRILRSSAGQITEFDVEHAAMSGSYILNFNNPIPGFIHRLAENSKVKILDHSVIYHLTDDVKDKLSELLPPTLSSRVLGEAEVLQVFPINLKGRVYKNIAGCRVRNGQLTRSAKYRVLRRGEKIFDGKADSLKQGKKDTSEVRKGIECGLSFEEWDDLQQGDEIQAYEEIREKRHL